MNCFSGLLCSIRDCAERDGLRRACQLFDKMLNRVGVPLIVSEALFSVLGTTSSVLVTKCGWAFFGYACFARPNDARPEFTLLSTIMRPRSLTGALLPWQVRYCVERMFLDTRLDLLRVGTRRT